MANQPVLAPGAWVQLNPSSQSPRAKGPSASEKTIGIVKQQIQAQGKQYFQVVWNPGAANPDMALYTADQLTPLDQQTASQLRGQLAQGEDISSNVPPASSTYQQPPIPPEALPQLQQPGMEPKQ